MIGPPCLSGYGHVGQRDSRGWRANNADGPINQLQVLDRGLQEDRRCFQDPVPDLNGCLLYRTTHNVGGPTAL